MNENINHLTKKQNEFSTKIKKVNDFYNSMNKNNKIIDTLQKEIKKNKKEKEDLENKINKMNIIEDEEINELKNKLKQLEEEKITKDENFTKYEKMFENVIESVNMKDEIRTDALKRLNEQISNYKSQIDKLLESKDNMQTYYIDEVKNLKEKIELLTKENAELKIDNEKILKENESQKRKYDLCNQEYTQFKNTFYSMSDIENTINEFNKSSGEVKNIRDFIITDELLKTKADIKIKNKELKLIKDSMNDTNNLNIQGSNRVSMNKNLSNNSTMNKKKNNINNTNNEIVDLEKILN